MNEEKKNKLENKVVKPAFIKLEDGKTAVDPFIYREWKPITENSLKNVKDGYFVSNFGEVKSTLKYPNGKLIKPQISKFGYNRINICTKDGNNKHLFVHRAVVTEFEYPEGIPEGYQVDHVNCNKLDNCITNLDLVTGKENMVRATNNNLVPHPKGTDSPSASLNEQQVRKICELLMEDKLSHQEIANEVGTTKCVVANISQGKRYTSICSEYDLKSRLHTNHANHSAERKIPEETVRQICEYLLEGLYTQKDIADACDVTESTVSNISRGIRYKDIVREYGFDGTQHYVRNTLSDESIKSLCQFFQDNYKKISYNYKATDLFRDALSYAGLNISDNNITIARNIFIRRYNTDISSNYNWDL